jgi:hypothetical protein
MILSTPYIIGDSSVQKPNFTLTGLRYIDSYYPLLYPIIVISPIVISLILFLFYKLKLIKEKPKFIKTILFLLIITLFIYHKWGYFMNPY